MVPTHSKKNVGNLAIMRPLTFQLSFGCWVRWVIQRVRAHLSWFLHISGKCGYFLLGNVGNMSVLVLLRIALCLFSLVCVLFCFPLVFVAGLFVPGAVEWPAGGSPEMAESGRCFPPVLLPGALSLTHSLKGL